MLPIRALYEIRAFSRPLTRPDWRTCKVVEANLVKESVIQTYAGVNDRLELYSRVNAFQSKKYKNVGLLVSSFTFYGQRTIYKQTPGWLRQYQIPPLLNARDYYLTQYFIQMP